MPNVNPEVFAIRQWCVRLVHERSAVVFASNLADAGAFEHGAPPCRIAPPLAGAVGGGFDFLDIRSLLNPTPADFP
jgi:hypothetical protein